MNNIPGVFAGMHAFCIGEGMVWRRNGVEK